MGNIGEPMTNQTVPPVGTSGTGYAATINLFLAEVRQRLEDSVPLSSVNIDVLNMANAPIQNAEYVGFADALALPDDPAGSIHYYNGDFYMVTSLGAVRVTNGTTLDVTAVGGITGDYGGSNPAELRFVDADKTYYFYDDFGGATWARLFGRSMDITGDDNGSQRVRLSWAGSSSYTLTFPVTPPGSTSLMQMSSAGDVTASNMLAGALTLPVDTDVVLSGTGKVQHGIYGISALAALQCAPGAAGVAIGNGPQAAITVNAGSQVNIHAPAIPSGATGSGYTLQAIKFTGLGQGGSTAPTITVDRHNSDSTLTNMPVTTAIAGSVTSGWEYTATLTTPTLIGEGATPVLRYTPAGASAGVITITSRYSRA